MRCWIFIFVFYGSILFSQEFKWAKTISFPTFSKGMLIDKDGNLFVYGFARFQGNTGPIQTDTSGTYFQKYSSDGNLIFSKHWNIPFFIQKIIYDGNNAFYFAGIFSGTLTINNITISARGSADGLVGKMDMAGNIQWLSTFGGGISDEANSLCFDRAKNRLVVTGQVNQYLYVNNRLKEYTECATIIAVFDRRGTLKSYRLYDIYPSVQSYENRGIEIMCDTLSGNYFLLADHEGYAPWTNRGRYVYKLNQNFDILWTKMAVSLDCYYGWICKGMSLSANSDICIPAFCAGKYGGAGSITRLNGNDGSTIWTGYNKDGWYDDTYCDSSSLYLIGTEGVNGEPAPGSHGGYKVIKKISNNNLLKGEFRIPDELELTQLTKSKTGTIFVVGWFFGTRVTIGNITLKRDSSTYSPYGNNKTSFIIALNDVDCMSPKIDTSIFHPDSKYMCPSDSLSIEAEPGYLEYLWSNGTTTPKNTVKATGNYWVRVKESSGCYAYSLPINVNVKENNYPPEICMVTVDSVTGKNKLTFWYTTWGNQYYKFYKRIARDKYRYIGKIPFLQSDKSFIDSTSTLDSTYLGYHVTTVDTCGTESPYSTLHRPIFLQVHQNGTTTTLSWQRYLGFDYTKCYIYRGTTPHDLRLLDSIDARHTSYTDPEAIKNYHYQIRIKRSDYYCYVTGNIFYNTCVSNITSPRSGRNENQPELEPNFKLSIFPNPSDGFVDLIIQPEGPIDIVMIGVKNILGQTIFSSTYNNVKEKISSEINISNEAPGLYFFEISSRDTKEVRKILKE